MLLAGDIGGTKTLLGLFDPRPGRPISVITRAFSTIEFADLPAMIETFRRDPAVKGAVLDRACFGVAGPVTGETAQLTNVPWHVDAGEVARRFNIGRTALLNDLEAMAYAVPVLQPHELHTIQGGQPRRDGNMALIAAGTGLGQALLHNINGRFVPSPSEGGHADFAARSERDIEVLRALIERAGRAEVEGVLSGPGLVNLYLVTHDTACSEVDPDDPDAPAMISTAALEQRCASCVETLQLFVDAYGAEAGNLGLRSVSTGGLFIGGGIAPKILAALTDGRFLRAFVDKAPLRDLVVNMPVHVILNADAGLLGAAVYAAGL
jgi:glucokinase